MCEGFTGRMGRSGEFSGLECYTSGVSSETSASERSSKGDDIETAFTPRQASTRIRGRRTSVSEIALFVLDPRRRMQ
jgi:hypothetical protein